MWVLHVAFWIFFSFTVFMSVEQLMYQENSFLYNWSQKSPGFHVLACLVVLWSFISFIACFIYHLWGWAGAWFVISGVWLISFLIYNRVIETDVQNRLSAGDFPDSYPTA